jgi:hypothetical protein
MERLDPTLTAEIERAKARGLDVKTMKFGIIIEHKEPIRKLSKSSEREKAIKELEAVAAEKQSLVISKLE